MSRMRGVPCDVYSRVTGYYTPVSGWNKGKQAEFHDRSTASPASIRAMIAEADARRTAEEAGRQVDELEAASAVSGEGAGV